ncbi:hypothetical protein RGU12_02020 [Fredinandcohnia sp. QZ13]|uniref:hypothetical protein n=1 Tax=Fredinandcohnia sp. QZ13 TaxID=3073144 RepID=UPI0028534462|nr:hypothetical protein [Fredinandcohnia sp. QZ13]MDR4886320.1 hypothetical protein [Fredinandcohnia sp. QZ13]
MNKEHDEKVRMSFKMWLAQWNDIPWANNQYHSLYLNVFSVYKFANNYISLESFLKNHGWQIEDWEEVDYLIRDIELTDKLLKRLPFKIRRNLLAAIQHYSRYKIASYLNCFPSKLTNIFNYNEESDTKDLFLLQLARLLDAPYWYLRLDSYDMTTDAFDEYNDVKTIYLKDLISEINIKPNDIKFLKIYINKGYFISQGYIYVKVTSYTNFKVIETLGLNFESDEIYDFINYFIRDKVQCIIVTPAILRQPKKKVIYVLKSCNEENSEEMNTYISTMKKRKFTRILKLNSENF